MSNSIENLKEKIEKVIQLELLENTLPFLFLVTSETHDLAYGSLILLQLPLRLCTKILQGYNETSLLLIFISGITLHS